MEKIKLYSTAKRMLADLHTPLGIYLRLRDQFRDVVLLENTDHQLKENGFSFIGIHAIAGVEIDKGNQIERKFPLDTPEQSPLQEPLKVPEILWNFMQHFECSSQGNQAKFAQHLFGYSCFESTQFFEQIHFQQSPSIPLMRYRLYQYVIAIDHFSNELWICENHIAGLPSQMERLEGIISGKDLPTFPFQLEGEEQSNLSDQDFLDLTQKGIQHCLRGDVFQLVISRRFSQHFIGDEINVYRALRSINPSPYLFYFDYGDYRIFGSSPESQLIIKGNKAIIHPIAGTFKRTGNAQEDQILAQKLLNDQKENAEHTMLVDLARNDLSKYGHQVEVSSYKKIHFFSHVLHMVSEVRALMRPDFNPFQVLGGSFPAGTLSGAPKFKALELINEMEPTPRGYYGGAIGLVGFDGSFNHAIMIRTFLSQNNTLHYQAGAGVVAQSVPESELQEVYNKLQALKQALQQATLIELN